MLRTVGLIVIFALVILQAPLLAQAEQPAKVHRVGVLWGASRDDVQHLIQAFEQGLRELGHVESRNTTFEYRFAYGKLERFVDLAADLVRLKVDAIVAVTNPAINAAKQATTTIPIVMTVAVDPVGAGFIAGLARPGGNITGLTFDVGAEIWGKRLELLKEAVPRMSRVGVIWNPAYSPNMSRWKVTEEAARKLSVTLLSAEVPSANDIERVLIAMIRERVGGIMVFGDPLVYVLRRQIADFATKNRLPTMSPYREAVEVGGLMAYGIDLRAMFRQVATYLDKILKGAKPADLPVEQPTRFELVINLKTAKGLGLTIPQSILIRADKVIQ